ncbi:MULTISPECIES: nicotinate-nucleotide--dimethylbenzimidazole phosphoribosyltransferase [Paenibacillus]|uniref:nicotinate-nucleotide--dimethylbenzimidazole phosphoribosyltransferase n=1 Tax=Paenibacillus TaxID=44249 RepID=UPI001B272725|nr:nicotinate-nucleotide--dimethylbenzimidazole phosphoribosyltransferase [Paenibacillus lactis]MCM3493089.1 nicotinate-nucleotide--dimethylbenzimidazole phosphoribosyltransferase [Paenibacillus lactis]GIO89795.1 nicotinate-nucleotide--dimethylbenzimidazole phosphoribosyltransferase [Paenibacillus lactis]
MKELMDRLTRSVGTITAPDARAQAEAAAYLDKLTKPPGSLGKLESLAIQLAGITGTIKPSFEKKAVVVMAGDHGVCEEGVSAFPSEVTPQMVMNFLNGGAAVNVLARQAGADVLCVDIGVAADLSHERLLSRKINKGTKNIAKGPAMTRAEAEQAILTGAEVAAELYSHGTRVFVTGEMGIGNTTPSAAVFAVLSGKPPAEVVGRGTGVSDERLMHKIRVVEQAITVNRPLAEDPVDVLAKVGGYEIGGLAGLILGAAAKGCPVVIDGFISSAAALIAAAICPESRSYMIASHNSKERGHALLLQALELSPMLHMDMRLGEGTGGVLCLHMIEAACRIMSEMATFESAGISGGEL